MFEKMFAKYARAVSDGREREYLFKKFKVKTVVSIIFYALCIAVIVLALVVDLNVDWQLILMTVLIFGWIGFAIADFCLWLSFRRTYNAILKRPADSGEMPEITAYRQKTVQDKKSNMRRLWWAWLIFGVCAAAFLTCIIIDTVKNPDSDEFGAFGVAAIILLLAGVLTIAFAYIFNNASKQSGGKSLEQQTAAEAEKIDVAQGRKHEYKLEADKNLQSYKYLFPNKELLNEAENIRKKYGQIQKYSLIPLCIVVLAGIVLFFCSEHFGKDVSGYTMPAVLSLIFVWALMVTLPMNIKLVALEKKQKAELKVNPEYELNYKWYKLYTDFSRFKGKILSLSVILGIALGWTLAILFPASAWSLFAIVPILTGAIVNGRLVKNLRLKAIPIEEEIDKNETEKV